MKLTISVLLVCVSVMVCQAAPVEDDSSIATAAGENALAVSDTVKTNDYRSTAGISAADKGMAFSRSRSFTGDDDAYKASNFNEKLQVSYAPAPAKPSTATN